MYMYFLFLKLIGECTDDPLYYSPDFLGKIHFFYKFHLKGRLRIRECVICNACIKSLCKSVLFYFSSSLPEVHMRIYQI